MIVELKRNLQVIIPRRIVEDLGLEVGDNFDVIAEDGVIKFIPVVVYSKAEADRLEKLASEARDSGQQAGFTPEPAPNYFQED